MAEIVRGLDLDQVTHSHKDVKWSRVKRLICTFAFLLRIQRDKLMSDHWPLL